MLPGMPEPQYISREDYLEMTELGMTVKEYKKMQKDNESKLEDMSIEELLEESVKDIHPTKRMPSVIIVDNFCCSDIMSPSFVNILHKDYQV